MLFWSLLQINMLVAIIVNRRDGLIRNVLELQYYTIIGRD